MKRNSVGRLNSAGAITLLLLSGIAGCAIQADPPVRTSQSLSQTRNQETSQSTQPSVSAQEDVWPEGE
jgi:hypothetical protein